MFCRNSIQIHSYVNCGLNKQCVTLCLFMCECVCVYVRRVHVRVKEECVPAWRSLCIQYMFSSLCLATVCLRWFACASMWTFPFCLSVPGRSHTVTFGRLTLPTSCVLLPFPEPQQVTHTFLPSLQTENNTHNKFFQQEGEIQTTWKIGTS